MLKNAKKSLYTVNAVTMGPSSTSPTLHLRGIELELNPLIFRVRSCPIRDLGGLVRVAIGVVVSRSRSLLHHRIKGARNPPAIVGVTRIALPVGHEEEARFGQVEWLGGVALVSIRCGIRPRRSSQTRRKSHSRLGSEPR